MVSYRHKKKKKKAKQSRGFVIPLEGKSEYWIEVEYVVGRGSFEKFVVRLIGEAGGRLHCVTRYDSGHLDRCPHRDVLGLSRGLIEKEYYENLHYRQAVNYAIEDFKKNAGKYYAYFCAH